MATEYSTRDFLRKVPTKLLKQYFQEKEKILKNFNFDELESETKKDLLYEAFMDLSDGKKIKIETEFQDINKMACQGGLKALKHEAYFHAKDENYPHNIPDFVGYHGRIMWTFLERKTYWKGGLHFLLADEMPDVFWKIYNDMPDGIPNLDQKKIKLLEDAVAGHFYMQGRGRNCKVEVYRRLDEKEYFFIYPEDFPKQTVVWKHRSLNLHTMNPAFEIIFVYTQKERSLEICARKNNKEIIKLGKIFADIIFESKDKVEFNEYKKVYVLNALAKRDIDFKYEENSGIERVTVTQLRLTLATGKYDWLAIKANTLYNPYAVYDILDNLKLKLDYEVSMVEIKVEFYPKQDIKGLVRTFRISLNSCNLLHDENDLIIRKMIIDSGLHPLKV